jgi:putative endonuclease
LHPYSSIKPKKGPIALPIAIGRLEHLTHNQILIIFFKRITHFVIIPALLMPFVYILYSPSYNQFYTGATTIAVERRLDRHLFEYYENNFTAKTQDWELFFEIECDSMSQAFKIESHIKAMKSKKYITDLKKYPAISEKLKLKYPST